MQKTYLICIIDQYFYQSYKKYEERKAKKLSHFALRVMGLFLAVPLNCILLKGNTSDKTSFFTYFLFAILASNVLETILEAFFYCTIVKNREIILQIAIRSNHAKLSPKIKNCEAKSDQSNNNQYYVDEFYGFKVSSQYYDFEKQQAMTDIPLDYAILREKDGEVDIKNSFEEYLCCYKILSTILQFVSASIFAIGCFIRYTVLLNEGQQSLFDIVLITEVMLKSKLYTIFLLIFLAPLYIIAMCGYRSYQSKKPTLKLPIKKLATRESIQQCSDCSICFQSYKEEDEILTLDCSKMHVFHYACIERWAKVKPNCPICRYELTQQ